MKNLLSVCILFAGINAFSQTFNALYPFTAVTATSGVTDPTTPPTATGVTFGAFNAVGLSANSSAGFRFSFSGWGTGSTNGVDTYSTMTGNIDLNKYYQVVITPSVNYGVTLNSVDFLVRRSGTGIRNFAARSNADGYTANIPCAVAMTQTNISIVAPGTFFWNFDATSTAVDQRGCVFQPTGSGYTNFTTPLNFRFYAWNAEGGSGTFSIDSVAFNGLATFGAGVTDISHDLNASFSIFPNPSNDGTVFVDTKKIDYSKIEVVNILGSMIVTEEKKSNQNEKLKLDLNALPSGTYFIRITSGNNVYSEKFFITK